MPPALRDGFLRGVINTFQAPSILSETESSIEWSLGQFSGDMANLDSAHRSQGPVLVGCGPGGQIQELRQEGLSSVS